MKNTLINKNVFKINVQIFTKYKSWIKKFNSLIIKFTLKAKLLFCFVENIWLIIYQVSEDVYNSEM